MIEKKEGMNVDEITTLLITGALVYFSIILNHM